MIQSPLNYTGGKYKLLPQILPLFPRNINVFVDLFCGGCNVGINIKANRILYNDVNENLIYLYNTFKNLDKEETFKWIYKTIEDYGLSVVSQNGYEYYGCQSNAGLGDFNRDKFLKLRADFNRKHNNGNFDYYYYIMLYVIIVYAFNNQIRFNARGEFNLPVGKRDFNCKMEQKLNDFIDVLKAQDCRFSCVDFRELDTSFLTSKDFVYVDPPYLITCATYNEQGGWNESDERDLLSFLDALNARGIPFALSNVLKSKGKENSILLAWLQKNADTYKAMPLHFNYSNSNYQTKDKTASAEEVLVINYREEPVYETLNFL